VKEGRGNIFDSRIERDLYTPIKTEQLPPNQVDPQIQAYMSIFRHGAEVPLLSFKHEGILEAIQGLLEKSAGEEDGLHVKIVDKEPILYWVARPEESTT
jgi:hypothetical protein